MNPKLSCFIAILFMLTCSSAIKAQRQSPKTRYLINETKPLKKTDTLAFMAPFVFSGLTKDYTKIDSTRRMYFDESLPDIDTARDFKNIETYYRNCCYFWYRMQFDPTARFYNLQLYNFKPYPDSELTMPAYNKHKNTYIASVSADDYAIIHTELRKMEKTLNDSLVFNLPISDLLYRILSKYSSSLCVLTDVKEYEYIGNKLGRKHASVCLYRIIIIDMKSKSIYFYNSEISGNDNGTEYAYRLPVGLEKRSPRENYRLKTISTLIGSKLKRE